MKSLYSTLLAALCMIATATFTASCSDDDPGNAPTTQEETKNMIIGLWKSTTFLGKDNPVDGYYWEFTADGQLLRSFHVKPNAQGKYAQFQGQYVVYHQAHYSLGFDGRATPTSFSLWEEGALSNLWIHEFTDKKFNYSYQEGKWVGGPVGIHYDWVDAGTFVAVNKSFAYTVFLTTEEYLEWQRSDIVK
ncbi:MAG: hypothetical protein MR893_08435 [Prevotellaceae bacterium]|nr:hypothetical protein [Prevotellaceae bacterium]